MPSIKALYVAEKNSVAKAIAAALGGGQRVTGPSPMNPITECKGQVIICHPLASVSPPAARCYRMQTLV
jgi:DNA topoisomerase IA